MATENKYCSPAANTTSYKTIQIQSRKCGILVHLVKIQHSKDIVSN
jgi:hypothetical protein